MTQLNAFVAHSFDSHDEMRIRPVLDFLETFQKAGFFCQTAEAAEVESVSKKVRRMIDEREVFIGFFTRRHPTYTFSSKVSGALQILLGKTKPKSWSVPAWVLQESGYALRGDKKLILLRETGVDLPALQGDLEYVPFDADDLAAVFSKLSDMINGLLADAAGTTVSVMVTPRGEQTQVAMEATVPPVPPEQPNQAGKGPDIDDRWVEMVDAGNKHDLDALMAAWKAGSDLIAAANHDGIDQIGWDSLYFMIRFRAGATDALEDLKRLRAKHSDRSEPKRSMASCYYGAKEFDLAGQLFLEAANAEEGDRKARSLVIAAKALRETKKYDDAIEAVKAAIPILPDDLLDEAISLHYQLLKARGDDYLAFATAEAALHGNPQLAVRFSLGLDYRLKGLNEIALYHFKFLYDRNTNNSGALHNLALLSADCKLPISAVERYKSAFSSGETLSAANLGYMYLDCGMAEQAKDLIDAAMKAADHVPAVEKCLADIIQRREREDEKETEILNQATDTRSFFLDMGRAMSAPVPAIDGRWRFPFGEMHLTMISGWVHGSADVTRPDSGFGFLLSGIAGQPAKKVDTHVFSGQLTGAVWEFQVIIREKGEGGVAAMILANKPTKFGFIVFASDGRSATYVELSDSKLGKTEIINKREGNLLTDQTR
jgi:tetratricopeptide (TPR) repeat protein